MIKSLVKKPFYVFVAVVIILVIGVVSLMKMPIDLMPNISMNYLLVITTEVGASPQQVEKDIIKAQENALGTINGVKQLTSTAAENYGLVTLQFTDDTDMDGALVRVSSALDSLDLPEGCGKPSIMEISMDMLASMYAAVDYEGKDIKEITAFTEDVVIPYLSRGNGVASITPMGEVENTVEIRLNQEKIDEINDKVLALTNDKLADAKAEIEKGKKEITKGKSDLAKGKKELEDGQKEANEKIADGQSQLNSALAAKSAYEAQYTSLTAQKTALEAEKKGYEDGYTQLNGAWPTLATTINGMLRAASQPDIFPVSFADAVTMIQADERDGTTIYDDLINGILTSVAGTPMESQISGLKSANVITLYNGYTNRIPQIEIELGNLGTEIMVAKATLDAVNSKTAGLSDTLSETTAAGLEAAATFGASYAKIESAESALEEAQAKIDDAMKSYDDARETALKNANIDALLSLDTLSKLIYAQNFSMPAGYLDDGDDNQWLLEVGEVFETPSDIENLVLTNIKDIGDIRVCDVADIVVIDNAGETYTKMNGNNAVLLSIYKASTASTYAVTQDLKDSFKELEEKYPGLSLTSIMNQGEYINMILKSVASSILLGAALAIFVLALFLKSVKPTIVVAFSIPFSVLFSLIVMYFTGIGINVMSLGGLTIAIGMLVDNSIVVMENIYRLVGKGVPAPKAAVQGAKQVESSIIASTVTTICVFFPMVYTTGMIADLMMPFAFTISYALVASLIVALSVVPTMSSVLLKDAKPKETPIFDKIKEFYGKVLEFCLNKKVVPLGISVALLVICMWRASVTGLVLLDDMESNQITASVEMPEDVSKDEAYERADAIVEAILSVDGIAKVGIMTGGDAAIIGMGDSGKDSFRNYSINILTDEDITTTPQFNEIMDNIEASVESIDAQVTVTSSALGEMSQLTGSGVVVNIFGDDQDKLIEINEEICELMGKVKGIESVDNGLDEDSEKVHVSIDKNKAAADGLTVATIYMELLDKLTTEKTAFTMDMDGASVNVDIVNKNDLLTYENLMDFPLEITKTNDDGEQETVEKKLSDYATVKKMQNVDSIKRMDQRTYMSVSGTVAEGYNATLVSRDVQTLLDSYQAPEGYKVEISGEYETVMEMVIQMIKALALGALLIYLVMVAQFQSLMSPFIIIFTVPLAFTGGMLGLITTGKNISALSLFGFMILMGTVVNNGIVFVDYVNQLRLKGVDKHVALIETGKTRMRPILMTALTTILSMSVMVFSQDAGNAMQKPMAIVVSAGLVYSTLMTLLVVPVLYDIFYRKDLKEIDVGEGLDDILDEASELIAQHQLKASVKEIRQEEGPQ